MRWGGRRFVALPRQPPLLQGYCGIEGNEKADELAKRASRVTPPRPEPFCGLGKYHYRALVILLSLIGSGSPSEDENNEIIIAPSSTKSPINLDTNLRKALLKALVELENEEKENVQRNSNDYVNIITHLDSRDKSVEKASASSLSFFTSTEPINMTITVKKTTSKPKHSVVVQKSKGTHKTIYETEDLNVSDTPEQIIASASNSFASAKSEKSKTRTGGAQLNSLTVVGKSKKSKFEQSTTTIKPTSSTEESEANVESLQFFSAPLVAAFTVHQDEKGLPSSVVPIYKQGRVTTNTTENQPETSVKNQEELEREVLKQQRELEVRQEVELRAKQSNLREEIQRLTKLREEQEKFIIEQKLLYEQKLLEQQKKLLEEQTRLFNVQSFVPVQPLTTTAKPVFQTNINDNFRSSGRNVGTFFSIQPSVGFVQPVVSSLPPNAQILPIKNPVDFRTPYPLTFSQFRGLNSIGIDSRPIESSQSFLTRSQSTLAPSTPLNTIQNSIVPSVNTAQNSLGPLVSFAQNSGVFQSLPSTQITSIFHQPSPISSNIFAANQNLPFASSQITPFRNSVASSHGSRILRQESGTGNFLNNNRYNTQQASNNFLSGNRFSSNSISPQQGSQTSQSLRSNFGFNSNSISPQQGSQTSQSLRSNFGFSSNSISPQQGSQTSQSIRNNFGFSNPNNLNQYNTVQYSVDQPFLNQRFNNLLLHTGLGQGKQQENLNIVSKVLSLNHLGAESQAATTNNDFTRIRAPAPWRVV